MRLRSTLAALVIAALPGAVALAALPDPLTFGVAIEAGDLNRARQWLDEGLAPGFLADRIGSGLMIAAWEGNIPMMELFVARGADIAQENRYGEQALQLAAWKGQTAAVRWLLDHGAAVNREGQGWSALHYAAFSGHGDVARLLMERGADVNGRAPNGSTVLMMAAREGHEDLASMLLDAGADPRATNERGDSALTWAMRYGNFRIAQLVSTKEQFAQAVKASPDSFGKAVRSEPAPEEIEDLLQRIRLAEAANQPTEQLREALLAAVARFKQGSTVVKLKDTAKGRSKGMVITASRQKAGERAELVYGTAATPAALAAGGGGDMGSLVEQLNRAKAAGRSTAELRKALFDAVAAFKKDLATQPPTPDPDRP